MRQRLLLVALVALAPLAPGCLALLDGTSEPYAAPDFALVTTRGESVNLSAFRGRVLVVDLMATWCVPCRAQMEHLNAVRDAYDESAVAILSVGTDAGESNAALDAFAEQYHGDWPFARDTDGVSRKLGLRILPKLVVIDPEGRVVFENQGETYPAAMARVVNRYAEAGT